MLMGKNKSVFSNSATEENIMKARWRIQNLQIFIQEERETVTYSY